MPNYDMAIITTVRADSLEDAQDWLEGFCDGLADTVHMPMTATGGGFNATISPLSGDRMIFLLPEEIGSLYTGPTDGPLSEEDN